MLWLAVLAVAAGLAVLVFGLRGRRVDDHPHCRECGFDLLGVYPGSEVCPECGGGLASSARIRNGLRRRRLVPTWIGLALALTGVVIAGMIGASRAGTINWNRIKPAWMLASDARGQDVTSARAAVRELTGRVERGELGRPRSETLVDYGVAAVAANGPLDYWDDFIQAAYVAGSANGSQLSRYFEQTVTVTTLARTPMTPEDALTVGHSINRAFGPRAALVLTCSCVSLQLDGTELNVGDMTAQWMTGGGSMTKRLPPGADPLTVGRHKIQARWRLAVRTSIDARADVIHEWTVESGATVDVDRDAEVALVVDDALRDGVRACIRLDHFQAGPYGMSGQLTFDHPPIPLAFNLLLKTDQKEYPIQNIAAPVGLHMDGRSAEHLKAPPRKRSNPAAPSCCSGPAARLPRKPRGKSAGSGVKR